MLLVVRRVDGRSGIRRPDLAGYAIDPMLDTILVDKQPVEVIQVWVDPARREAHRDPAPMLGASGDVRAVWFAVHRPLGSKLTGWSPTVWTRTPRANSR